jgi:hypothetical protein
MNKPHSSLIGVVSAGCVVAAIVIGCARQSTRLAPAGAATAGAIQPPAPADIGAMSDDWLAFRGESGDLTALFPASFVPRRVDDAVDSPIGSQKIVRFVGRDDEQDFDAGYLIRSSNPLAALAGERRILDAACDGTARHLGGTVRSSRPCEVDGHAARDLDIALPADAAHPDGRRALARLIITDQRIYHAIVNNVNDEHAATRAQRFTLALRPADS